MTQEIKINAEGAVCYWSCGDTHRDLLTTKLAVLGLDKFLPEFRSNASALKAALKTWADARKGSGFEKLILPLHKQEDYGFEVHNLRKGDHMNDLSLDFAVFSDLGTIRVKNGQLDDYSLAQIQQFFDAEKHLFTGSTLGGVLVKIVEHLGGVVLRPHGGIYWLPAEALPQFGVVADAVESSSVIHEDNKCYQVKTIVDENTVRAVRDAIVAEVEKEAAEVELEIRKNECGKRRLDSRVAAAKALHARISKYEGYLGETLAALHGVVSAVEQEGAAAIAVLQSETAFEGVF